MTTQAGESVKKAEHRGYQIAYETLGDGPPVVIQHGIFSNRRAWIDYGLTPLLSDAYRLILVDSLGHGDSDKPNDPPAYSRQFRAGDIAAVLDHEGIDRSPLRRLFDGRMDRNAAWPFINHTACYR